MEALKAAEGEPAETALSMLNELVGLVQGEDDQGLEVAVATGLAGLAMTGRALRFLGSALRLGPALALTLNVTRYAPH